MIRSTLIFALLATPALAQVRVYPPSVTPDQLFVVEVDALFPDPCQLDGDLTVSAGAGILSLDFAAVDGACAQVVTPLARAYGPFRLDPDPVAPGDSVRVTVSSPVGLVGEATLNVVETPTAAPTLLSGLYWDPEFDGLGVSLAGEFDTVFLAAYAYGPQGEPVWHVAQGRLDGAVAELELMQVTDGPCLTCGPVPRLPSPPQATGSASLVLAAPARAFLAVGDAVDRVLALQAFPQRQTQSEGTIAGVTFAMPDLGGRWLFTGPDGEEPVTAEIAQRPTGFADSGMAWFESEDGAVRLECGFSIESAFRCALIVDGETRGSAEAGGITFHAIRSPAFLGFRLD